MRIERKTGLLSDLTGRIASGDLAVPTFQRPYAWSRSDVVLLFDSISRGWPIGSFMLWTPDDGMSGRPSTRRRVGPCDVDDSRAATMLLDGQNRLTTMLWAANGGRTRRPAIEEAVGTSGEAGTWGGREILVADGATRTLRFAVPGSSGAVGTVPSSALFDRSELEKRLATVRADASASEWIRDLASSIAEATVAWTVVSDAVPDEVRELLMRSCGAGVVPTSRDFDAAVRWYLSAGGIPKTTVSLRCTYTTFPKVAHDARSVDVGVRVTKTRRAGTAEETIRGKVVSTRIDIHDGRAWAPADSFDKYGHGSPNSEHVLEILKRARPELKSSFDAARTAEEAGTLAEKAFEDQDHFVYDGTRFMRGCGDLRNWAGTGGDCVGFSSRMATLAPELIPIDGTDHDQVALARSFFSDRGGAKPLCPGMTAAWKGDGVAMRPFDAVRPLAFRTAAAAATSMLYVKLKTGTSDEIGRAVAIRRLMADEIGFERDRTGWIAELRDIVSSSEAIQPGGHYDGRVLVPLGFLGELAALSPNREPAPSTDVDDEILALGF